MCEEKRLTFIEKLKLKYPNLERLKKNIQRKVQTFKM